MKLFLRFSSVLSASPIKRLIFLFFTLFALSIPTWGANVSANAYIYLNVDGYTDIQNKIAAGDKLQVLIGHGTWSEGYLMERTLGTKYLYQVKMISWGGCTQLCFITGYDKWGGEGSSPTNRKGWATSSTPVYSFGNDITTSSPARFYKNGSSLSRTTYSNYTVTVTTPTNGSISLLDYDNRAVASGDKVSYLTVLKVTATPNDGYELESVKIGSTTYTADQFTQGQEYTVTAATTISATFKASTCSEAPTIKINNTPSVTANSITANVTATATGANCTLSDVGLDAYTDQACTNKVKSVSEHATSGTALDLTVSGLTHNTTYYVKAHATTGGGTTYTDAVEVKTEALLATYAIAGTFNDWNTQSDACTVLEGSEDACSITKELAAETTYKFKFLLTNSSVTDDWHGNGGTMTSGNCTGWTFETNNETDCQITTTIAGEYIFSMQYKEGHGYQVSVTYPTPTCDETNPCIVPGSTLYLQPNANWKAAGARFAAYFFNNCTNQNTWVSMTDADKDGIYECEVPEGNWMNLIFCRMNPASAENNWNDGVKWNQTADLSASCGYDLFVMPENVWDNADDSNWTYQIPDVKGAYIAATRNITTVCNNDLSRFASLYVHQTGEEDAENEGYEVKSYQWKYSTAGTNWNNYTPDEATEYGVKGKNNNIRTYQTGHYRCDITLSNGTDSKVLQSNVIEVTAAADCNNTIDDIGMFFPVFYITTTENFPICSESYNSVCGEAMKAKRTVDVKMYNKGQLCYDRKARMNIRGSSSMNFDKKSYAFVGGKADAKVGGAVKTDELSFFGLPEHKDWVLYAAYADASMIRNVLAMQAYGTMTGMWSCHTQYVNVYMDGKYAGAYVFMEKPTYGPGRVMVNKDNGYLFGFDKTATVDRFESDDNSIDAKKNTFVSMYSGKSDIVSYDTKFDQRFEIEYPEREKIAFDDDENLVNEQAWTNKVNTLKARINEFEQALSEKNYGRVREVIDYQTWADWFIMVEFCKNVDGFRASNWFIIENTGAPIKASPIWDFELSFGNTAPNSTMGESTSGWLHEQDGMHTDGFPIPFWFNGIGATNANTGDKDGTGWTINKDVNFGGLLKDPCFREMVKERWAVHTAHGGGIHHLIGWVNNQDNYLNLSTLLAAEEARWPAANRNKMGYDAQPTWDKQWIAVRDWVTPRKEAMDALINAWTLGYMHTKIEDSSKDPWQMQTPTKTDGVNVYTFNEGRESLVLVGYTKATNDPNGPNVDGEMQAATIWKFYASTQDMTADALDQLAAANWQVLTSSGNYHLPALSQNENGYYKVEGPLCGTNLQSSYLRIKVTPTCEQSDCNSYWYRIKLTDKQTGDVFYSAAIKGVDGTALGTLTIPCQGEFDYVIESKHGATYWTAMDGKEGVLSAASFRGATTLQVELLNCKASKLADEVAARFTPATEGVTPYYQVAFYYGGELLAGVTSLEGESGITNSQSKVFDQLHFPVGTTYVIYRRDNNKTYDARYSCIADQNYVPSEYTNLADNQSVTTTFSVSDKGEPSISYQVITQESNYWISTPFAGHKGFDGGEQNKQHKSDGKDNNTMFAVECQGVQGGAQGDYYLYKYMEKENSWDGKLAQAGVKDGNNDNVEVATNADEYGFHGGNDMHSVWVRWLFNSEQGKLYIHHVHNLQLECKDNQGNITRVKPTTSNTATGMLTFSVNDLTNVASYRIVADHPHGNGAFEQQPWGADYHPVMTNLGSATFTYNYAQNCLSVEYSDIALLSIPCQEDGIRINSDGRVEITVNNIGTLNALAGSYTVVVTNHATKLTMRGTGTNFVGKALAPAETEVFTSTDVITGSYYLEAKLYYGTQLMSSCSLADLDCEYVVADTVRYTVDANLGLAYQDPCTLTFGSLENALAHLKGTPKFVKGGSLAYPVVMEVAYSSTTYQGTRKAGVSGGGTESENAMALIIDNFNQLDATHPLIIRAADPKAQPWVQHVIIRNARNITLDGLFMVSDVTGNVKDNALEIDINNSKWDMIPMAAIKDANIVVKNSTIGSSGFTGLHASGYDGITFINNNFEAVFDGKDGNATTWGASAKFIRCKNIKFMRNNFRGDHATLVWLQESTDAVFMNNVFWNTNQYQGRCAAIRLVSQFGLPVSNMGFYYNTLYLADNEVNAYKYDFLHFGQQHSSIGHYPDSYTNIEFMYNNAYSYDTDIPGRNNNADAFLGIDVTTKFPYFCKNNFWSEYDEEHNQTSQSLFSFGCAEQDMINVREQLCQTTATGPASLIVRGSDLNVGYRPSTELATALTADQHNHDRYLADRPADGTKWTLGAYQMGQEKETQTIIWQGVASTDWDDRNNWIDKETGMRLNCLNVLSKDLVAIIPAEFSTNYPRPAEGIRNWPKIPDNFADGRTNMEYSEHVSAGLGVAKEPSEITQYVKTIIMEYGSGIQGVERLVSNAGSKEEVRHYDEVTYEFNMQRSQWVLVGTVVKKADAKADGGYRNVISGDYYIANHEPHVYMHQAVIDPATGQADWAASFPDLDVEVPANKVFAIQIPDQYGPNKLTAARYYRKDPDASKKLLGSKPWAYSFTGRYVNESQLPIYTDLEVGRPNLLNNSYPMNIDARILESQAGSVLLYDYTKKSFGNITGDGLIKPQHGFVIQPNSSVIKLTPDMMVGGDTKSRSIAQEKPLFVLQVNKANSTGGEASTAHIVYDALTEGMAPAALDTRKVWSYNSSTPDVYVLMYDDAYQRVHVGNSTQTIALGISLKEAMPISFQKASNSGFSQVTLVDTYTGKEYNLLGNDKIVTETLPAGVTEGRFYLNIEVNNDFVADDDVTTPVESITDQQGIQLYVQDGSTISITTTKGELKTVYVSDITGRTQTYNVHGTHVKIRPPVANGVYTVRVVGNETSRIEKVILNK